MDDSNDAVCPDCGIVHEDDEAVQFRKALLSNMFNLFAHFFGVEAVQGFAFSLIYTSTDDIIRGMNFSVITPAEDGSSPPAEIVTKHIIEGAKLLVQNTSANAINAKKHTDIPTPGTHELH